MDLISSTAPAKEPPPKKRKGPKGPNPLSMKKKVIPASAQAMNKHKHMEESKTIREPAVLGEVKVGEKRQRDNAAEELDDERDDQEGFQEVSKKRAGGHKRKRRRKAAANVLIPPDSQRT
jgi:U3 small nucleolar RNA-associated protein 23